ncbi:MAG: PLP-dependent aminotransferase family protein, partial [Pseudomonadota bacterium]|nr:PLP-dependent aminotransferase family protein [Pseudomonadota bacterium]
RLPYGWRTAQFVHAAENSGVLVRSAEEFTLRDGNPPHAVRIAVNGMVDPECFEDGIIRLVKLLDNPREEIGV